MRKRTKTRLVDSMISAYIDCREACRIVPSWASATRPGARAALGPYATALDAQEREGEVYASLVRRVGHLRTSEGELARRLAV